MRYWLSYHELLRFLTKQPLSAKSPVLLFLSNGDLMLSVNPAESIVSDRPTRLKSIQRPRLAAVQLPLFEFSLMTFPTPVLPDNRHWNNWNSGRLLLHYNLVGPIWIILPWTWIVYREACAAVARMMSECFQDLQLSIGILININSASHFYQQFFIVLCCYMLFCYSNGLRASAMFFCLDIILWRINDAAVLVGVNLLWVTVKSRHTWDAKKSFSPRRRHNMEKTTEVLGSFKTLDHTGTVHRCVCIPTSWRTKLNIAFR